ncbi:hypothetical protein TNCV_1071961 [Trichonephila clavipes]|nr:hypothetical protein TNCV_1071961 [Trichonephila clavipes]
MIKGRGLYQSRHLPLLNFHTTYPGGRLSCDRFSVHCFPTQAVGSLGRGRQHRIRLWEHFTLVNQKEDKRPNSLPPPNQTNSTPSIELNNSVLHQGSSAPFLPKSSFPSIELPSTPKQNVRRNINRNSLIDYENENRLSETNPFTGTNTVNSAVSRFFVAVVFDTQRAACVPSGVGSARN